MAQLITVRLNKGDAPNWGFRLQGGKDFGTPLVIQKVNCGSPAERAGLVAGDSVIKINSTDVFNLRHKDAQDVIVRAGPSFEMSVQRGGSTWKPTVTPTGSFPKPTPTVNNVSPVTKTSLAAPKQNNIGAIGTGHNVSAKPFAAVNGTANGPKLVNKQFNSPIGLYSEDTIAETLSAQAEVLAPGVLGVNFKKNEKNYDATNSAVYRMLQEAEKEPREPEQEQETGSIVTSPQPVAVAGLRHVSAPETKPTPPTPQLPPGQNICADCERLIVGVFVRIKDKNLHVECFKCSTCGTSLKNVGYYNINNKLYCDIHAKLAARSNPPAPNLVPVTVPPGGKTPSGAISAALASHGPPPAGPLSPNTNSIATPFQNNHDSVDCSRSLKENETFENSERFVSELVIPIKENDTNHNNNKLTKTNLMMNSCAKYLKGAGSNLSGPRPFSSVSGPLSPPLNSQSSLPRSSPLSPPITNLNSPTPSAGRFSSVKPTSAPFKGRSVQSIVWPPPSQSEPELPTACPLYFPPPSHVHVEREKKLSENCESEVEQINMSRFYEPKLSLCSSEVTGIMKSASECVETISDTIDTQRLVENILKNRPKSPTPPPQPENVEEKTVNPKQPEEKVDSADRRESFDLKRPTEFSPNTLETSKPNSPKSKIDNPVPKGWESPMVVALTVASDIPIKDISIKCSNRPNSSDMFSQIPPKRSSSALASALAIAPTEPFTPIPSTLEPVPLPEETVPYMPPEHLFHIEPKEPKPEKPDSEFVSALKTAPERPFTPAGAPVRKKKQPEDELLKDLPKPQEKLSMLAALTTAPDRPYSPLVVESVCIKREEKKETKIEEKTEEHPPLHKSKKPNVLPQSFQPVAAHEEEPPLKFPPITQSTFEYKADYSQIKSELSSQIIEQSHMIEESELIEKQESETRKIEKQEIKEEKIEKQEAKVIEKQAEDTIYMKPLPLASALHKPGALPQYQVNFSETVEASLKMLDKIESQAVSEVEAKKALIPAPTLELKHHLPPTKQVSSAQKDNKKPVITVEPGQMQQVSPQMSFQPVIEDRPPSTSFSPRPRPLTPSMINKPPPTIPYYQANLVAQHHRPVEVNLLDPKSPAISRSPSPCPEKMRSSSPFRPPSACSERAKSPAPGPPPNPLKSSQPLPTPEDTRREEAKKSLSNFIPQYRDKMEMIEKAQQSNQQFYSGTVQVQGNAQIETAQDFVVESHKSDLMQKQTLEEQVFDSNKVSKEGSMTTSIKEHADSKRFEQLNKADFESVEKSADGSVQVQRKKMVTEEYEHVHKEKTIEIEKSSEGAKKYPFQKVNAPVTEDKIVGLRVTNPQPLVSPFLANNKQDSKCCTVPCKQPCQDTCKSSQSCQSTCGFSQLSQGTCSVSQVSSQPTFQSTCSAPQQSFQKLETNHSASARQNVPSSSTQNVIRPNVSQPNAGTSGGRQAGAIGVAPKRGRGVLNPAAIGGARIPLCGQCHSYIRGPFITALGKIWCPEHFICATPSCRRQLHDLGFVEEKGQLYCEYCFEQYLAPPCSKCSAKIKGDCLKAIGKNFHPECFNCAYCGKLFGNSPFFLEDGLPYCEADWNELFTTKCFACGFPVEAGDRWVEALNNNYHSQCFNCTMCKKNLEGQSFFAKGGRPFCKNHAR